MLSNPQLFGTGVLILALSVNHLHIIFLELPNDETKGQKYIPKFPIEKMGKKRRNPKIMETLSEYLITLDYANQEVRIINMWSYSFLAFHLLRILKNTRQPSLHFIHMIDSVDLPKASSSEMYISLICILCSSESYH